MEDSHEHGKKICRLCLMKCEKYEVIERNIRNNMDVLLLNINPLLSEEPLICNNCSDILKASLHFKTMCLDSYKYIVSFVSDKNNIKIDLKTIYLNKQEYATDVQKDFNICGFCMGLVKSCFAISLVNEEDNNILQKMLKKCFPELNFSIIKEPIICAPCHGHLKGYFSFMTKCWSMEKEIGKYCETLDNKNNTILKDLSDVQQFVLRNKVTCVEYVNSIDKNKEEKYRIHPEHFHGDGEFKEESITEVEDQKMNNLLEFPLQDISLDIIDKDRSKIELQEKFCDGTENIVEEYEIKRELETIAIEDYKYDNILLSCKVMSEDVGIIQNGGNFVEGQVVQKNDNYVGVEDQKYLVNDEIELKTEPLDFNSFQSCSSKLLTSDDFLKYRKYSELDHQLSDPLKERMYQCEACPYQSKHKKGLKRHLLVHKDPSEVTMYRCESCPYQSKHKKGLKSHLLVHKDPSEVTMYRCESCTFQTKFKETLTRHLLVHMDPSIVTMYQCESCPFRTKRKDNLKKHSLSHKDPSEVTMYQCKSCPFQTKRNYLLNTHSLVHEHPSKVTMYRCESCSFQTKFKGGLKRHLLIHVDDSKLTMYRCESCPYQTRYKYVLRSHMLGHMDPSKVTMYQCESCPYETKYKRVLNRHLLVHEDASNATTYRCESCPYQAKHKYILKRHLLVHMDPPKVTMYRCESCPFETKLKEALERHLLVHENASNATMYRCESCSYRTKHKHNLRNHLLIHKDPSKIIMYQCETCPFQTKRKHSLKLHSLVHKDTSKATMFQCDTCSFQTKYKNSLMRHLLVYMDPSKLKTYQCKSCPFQTKRKCGLILHSLVHVEPSKVSVSM